MTAAKPDGVVCSTGASRWFWPSVAACLFVQVVLAVDCARQWTPTHDEYWHLPIGLRMWTTGRLDDDVINPPLVRLWASIPLALGGARPGDTVAKPDVGDIGDAFWSANVERVRTWYWIGRLMIVPLATLTGLAVSSVCTGAGSAAAGGGLTETGVRASAASAPRCAMTLAV